MFYTTWQPMIEISLCTWQKFTLLYPHLISYHSIYLDDYRDVANRRRNFIRETNNVLCNIGIFDFTVWLCKSKNFAAKFFSGNLFPATENFLTEIILTYCTFAATQNYNKISIISNFDKLVMPQSRSSREFVHLTRKTRKVTISLQQYDRSSSKLVTMMHSMPLRCKLGW